MQKRSYMGIGMVLLLAGTLVSMKAFKTKPSMKELVGTAVSYADADNWMVLPAKTEHAVDVIYLYPTAYSEEGKPLIADIKDAGMRQGAQHIYAQQGTAFEGVANIYAPYYRQINGAKFMEIGTDNVRLYGWKEPRTDLYAALDYYFAHYNQGRPYMLAAHSQGANMLNIILAEYMAQHPEHYSKMIVAYQLGCSLTKDFLAKNPHVKFAQGSDDVGVTVSWNVEGPANAECGETLVVMKNSLSINPLNWKTDDSYADKSQNKGSLVVSEDGQHQIIPNLADAQLNTQRGTVVCASVDSATHAIPMPDLFGPASYHGHDYALYYINIRDNARERIKAWFEKKK